jgi:hypothetical protein
MKRYLFHRYVARAQSPETSKVTRRSGGVLSVAIQHWYHKRSVPDEVTTTAPLGVPEPLAALDLVVRPATDGVDTTAWDQTKVMRLPSDV